MSALSNLRGNAAVKADIGSALAAGRLPHAVLLAAPAGAGGGFAARCLAADYLFPAGGPGAAAVLRGESPEVLLVEGEGKSGNIKVERIRAIRSDVFRSALSAAGRVVYIKGAHRMAPPAYNALLKVLEEPPADVLFILTARDAAAIPETVRSRCAVYNLAPVSTAECETALVEHLPADADPKLATLLATVYGGRIGAGLACLQNPARLETLRAAIQAAKAVAQNQPYGLLAALAPFEGRAEDDRQRREDLLADLGALLAAALRGAAAPGLPALSPKQAATALPLVSAARQRLAANVAFKIEATALAVRIARA